MNLGRMSTAKLARAFGAVGVLCSVGYGGFIVGSWHSNTQESVQIGSSSSAPSIPNERLTVDTETRNEFVAAFSGQTTSRETSEILPEIHNAFRETNEVERIRRLTRLVEELDPAAIKTLCAQLDRYPYKDREELCKLLVSRWAQFNPAEALNYAALIKEAGIAGTALRAGLSVWVSTNPYAAREWLSGPIPLRTKRFGMELLVDLLARKEPEMALRMYEEDPQLRQDPQQATRIIDRWAMNDPAAASRAVLQMSPGPGRDNALAAVALRWAEADAQAALAWVQQLADPEMRVRALSDVLKGWAKTDPNGARSHALSLPLGEGRTKAITAVGSELARQDPAGAIALAQQLAEGTARDGFLREVIQTAASTNPQGAAQMIDLLPEGEARANAASTVMDQWLNLDRPKALEWLTQLPFGESRARAFHAMMQEWGKAEPKAAFEWVVKNAPPADRETFTSLALDDSMGAWIEGNRGEAIDWLTKLPVGDTKDRLIGVAAVKLADSDPKGAVAFIQKNGSPDAIKQCSNMVAIAWSKQEPAAAAAWAWTLPEGEVRGNALRFVGTEWCKRDPAKAAAWLNTLPAGTERDTTVVHFARTAINADPESALEWTATIGEAEKRNQTLEELLKTWIVRDQPAARIWLSSTQAVSPEFRDRMMSYR